MWLQPVATSPVQFSFQSFCSPMDWTFKLYPDITMGSLLHHKRSSENAQLICVVNGAQE